MIKSFKHKGIQLFFNTGNVKEINPDHSSKIARILDRLDASKSPLDMNLPAYKLHKLKGDKESTWSVWVNGNWRITFLFENEDAILIDYIDYH